MTMVVLLLLLSASPARADCAPGADLVGPHMRSSWVEGGLVYDTTNDVLKTCDGTNWNTIGGTSADIPQMTRAQRDALANPAEGMVIYQSTEDRLEFYNGTDWRFSATVSATNPYRYCTENQNCGGTPVLCWAFGGTTNNITFTPAPAFGAWSNTQCSVSGTGWSVSVDSCSTGIGTKRIRCNWVIVENAFDTTYPTPPKCVIANGYGVMVNSICYAATCNAGYTRNAGGTACQ